MAKLSGFQCDRCGAHYDKNRAKDSQGRCDFNLVGVGLLNIAGQIFRTDLCDSCMAELQTWLDDPKMGVTLPDSWLDDPDLMDTYTGDEEK